MSTGINVTPTLSSLGGVPTTRTLTINGTAQDLSADRSWTISTGLTIGTTAITSGTAGRVLFEGTGNVLQESARFTFDSSTNILQLGSGANAGVSLRTIAPGATNLDIAFRVRNSVDNANILTVQGDGNQTWFEPGNNTLSSIRVSSYNLIQWSNNLFNNVSFGLQNSITATTYRNTIAGSSCYSLNVNDTVSVGYNIYNYTSNSIAIGNNNYILNGSQTIKIGHHDGASAYGGTNSIHLGRTPSGNNIAPDNVFMTYFNSQNASTVTRSNGSLGLFGQQNQLTNNGTGANGLTTFMGDGGNTLVVRNHTSVPSLNITDSFQLYSADITAGNAAPHFRTENGAIIKVYQETTAVAAATLVGNAGTNITDTDTFDGYTLKQIVKALRNQGLLA